MLLSLRLAPRSLVGVWISFWTFNLIRLLFVLRFHFFTGPLVAPRPGAAATGDKAE